MDFKKIIKVIPLIMGLLIIPVSMRMIKIDIPFEVQLHWKGVSTENDIFGYYRSILLIINAVITSIILFFSFTSDTFIRVKKLKPVFIAFGILVLFSILSTLFGGNTVISYGGAPTRYEGLYTFIGYYFLFLYAVTLDYDDKTQHIIIIALAIFTVACSIVGFFQYIGKDLFLTPTGAMYYIPDSFKHLRGSMETKAFSFRTMYIFNSHYNYSSFLMGILSSFWIVYTIVSAERFYKILSAVMTVLSILMLLGTNGRSGIVALFITVVFMIVIFFSDIRKNKVLSIAILAILLIFIAVAVKLGMMSRITDLFADIQKVGKTSSQDDNYIRSQIPLKNITTTDNSYTIEYDTFTLKFDKSDSQFFDENNNLVEFTTPTQGQIVFSDPKYADVRISVVQRRSNTDLEKTNMYHEVKVRGILFNFDISDKVTLVNHMGLPIYPEKATRMGFKGMEKLGSGRGFITASTIPLILKSPIIGYGPDSFLQVFNQDDIYTKMYVYGNPSELVDKPHNLYLLFAINFGLVGLVAFLFIVIYLLVKAKKRYKDESLSKEALYVASIAAVLAYMGGGLFNDSTSSVSPIFWVLLGVAMSKIGIKED
jgi:O-antigen polymerase superfamily protein